MIQSYNPWFNSWPSPWQGFLTAGNVAKDINPITTWMSPSFEFNYAGDREIEAKVVTDVAGYGTQLGKLSEAVLELARGEKGEAIKALEGLVVEIEKVKIQHLESKLENQLDALKASNPKALKVLLSKYS